MSTENAENDQGEATAKPQPARRRPKTGRYVWVYDANNNELAKFPEATVGRNIQRGMLDILSRPPFGPGSYRIDLRNAKGHPEPNGSFPITISGTTTFESDEDDDEHIIDVTDGDQGDDGEGFVYEERNGTPGNGGRPPGYVSQAELENILLKEKLQSLEQQRAGGQSEIAMMMQMLQTQWSQERAFMMQMLQQNQNAASQPQQDPTAVALNLMEKSLGMVKSARAMADELAPPADPGGGEGGWLADGARLISAVGPHIPTLLSFMGPGAAGQAPPPPGYPVPPGSPTGPPPGQGGGGDLAELRARVQAKKENSES